jgi:hypothetical protein
MYVKNGKSEFKKAKICEGIRYGKLSKLAMVPGKKGAGKMNTDEYRNAIIESKMLDF